VKKRGNTPTDDAGALGNPSRILGRPPRFTKLTIAPSMADPGGRKGDPGILEELQTTEIKRALVGKTHETLH